jgi:tetratricopeptide (TPR) repeat protein
LELDPLVNAGSTFNSYLHAGDYAKFLSSMPAEDGARKTFYRGLCFYYQRDNARAAAEFERAYVMDPSLLHAKYGKAFLYAIRNQPAEGRQYLKELERENLPADGEMLYKMAQAYAAVGDSPSALRLLRRTIDRNFYCHACFLRDPLMTSLHGEPQYDALLELARDRHARFKRDYF